MCIHAEFTVDALYRAHYSGLCAFAQRYVICRATAEDIVQDVFVEVWALRNGGATFVNPERYLYRAVRNGALKHIGHKRIATRAHAMMQGARRTPAMSTPPISADEALEAAELEEAYDRAIGRLPARCREAHVRRKGGMTPTEIGTEMGTSMRTAETQIRRARRFLRRELAPFLESSV